MKVTGFTFIRNAVKFDYPVVEAITSILPICDDFVVAVGNSDDDTLGLIKSIDPNKIKIIETVWDDNLREGGRVLAEETNKAFAAIPEDTDWAFYIQGDEVVHEKYLDNIKAAMEKYKNNDKVDGLLFNYHHFYGSFDYVGVSSNWYFHEIRVIKNNKNFYSYKDAQGFRKDDNQKLVVAPIDAYMYHYGWVRPPEKMGLKQNNFETLYRSDKVIGKQLPAEQFTYDTHLRELKLFNGTHPKVIQHRIALKNWKFEIDISLNKTSLKDKFKSFLKFKLGIDTYYKNYIVGKF
ncbi:MAG: glycosyltransferase family 2 protein [Flavobacteriaceae bacterium]|nr:glycosyltransferase family 2 protein [Flavobacteriaceae bacterium]